MMEKNVAISDNTDSHTESKPKFFKFVLLILIGFTFGFYFTRKGFHLTPESFKNYVLSLGIAGPILYVAIFIIRPLFLIPSIALFIGGGLAFGPILGPTFASLGAALGGTVGFWFSRKMGHEYAIKKLKLGAGVIDNTKFSFSVVFLLSLIPIMPVTVINYGAGLSTMRFNTYISAHILGMIPRAFAFGYFGNTLLEVGSKKFMAALLILVLMGIMTAFYRLRTKQKKRLQLAEEVSASN